MTFSYRAITANCGNDVLGEKANRVISNLLRDEQADFYIINCQEVKFNQVFTELKKTCGNDYSVMMLGSMNTYTKGPSRNEGMASYIIHKKDIEVGKAHVEVARRSMNPFAGTPYNKGGLITKVLLTRGEDRLHLETVSGHLDSTEIQKRAQDWLVINKALAKPVRSWPELENMMPHLRISGYDANTRDRLKNNTPINQWLSPDGSYEIQGLQQATIENQRYSRSSTYRTDLGERRLQEEDKKRPGFAKGGTLDFVGIADGGEHAELDTSKVISVSFDMSTKRDHDVIISPLHHYEIVSPFERVKGQLAARLASSAPMLAKGIRALSDDFDSRHLLVTIYQEFLSKEGLLNTELSLFQEKLTTMDKIEKLHPPAWALDALSRILFSTSPWFELSCIGSRNVEEIQSQQSSVNVLLKAFNKCNNLDSLLRCLEENSRGLTISLADSQVMKDSRDVMNRFRRSTATTASTSIDSSSLSSSDENLDIEQDDISDLTR